MFTKRKKVISLALVCGLTLLGCTRNWNGHNNINDADLSKTLFQKISEDESLSLFAGYLERTGYDDTLQLSVSFTVWAPDNNALAAIDGTIRNNDSVLKQFVAHHIARLSYYTTQVQTTPLRIPLLDGKYAWFRQLTFDSTNVNTKDRITGNGVLHTISGPAAPLASCWELLETLKASYDMPAYLKSLWFEDFDPNRATQIGINPHTGDPIYDSATGKFINNYFLKEVHSLDNEAKEFTVFILNNTSWESERSKLDTFYKTPSIDTTRNLARWYTAKDLVIEGAYAPGDLPDSVQSKFGVWVPINKSAIAASYRTSNGYVYVMNDMNVPLRNKFPPLVVEGENIYNTSTSNWTPVFRRTLINPNNNQPFTDLYVYDHRVNKYYIWYLLRGMPTVTYKIYWATYNNRHNNILNQRLCIGSPTANTFAYRNVPYNVYSEEYLGTYTISNFGSGNLSLYLVSADIAPSSSNQNQNAMFLDYIRLEPVIQ